MNPDDVFKVVCDNASNMKKAFKVSLWEEDDAIQTELIEVLQENEFEPAVHESEEFQDITVDLLDIFREQYRLPCNIHTLQLFV